jgi:hypothetical protein
MECAAPTAPLAASACPALPECLPSSDDDLVRLTLADAPGAAEALVRRHAGWFWWVRRDPNGAVQIRETQIIGKSRQEVIAAAAAAGLSAAGPEIRRSEGDLQVVGSVGDAIRFGSSRTHRFFHVLRPEPPAGGK